MAVTLTPLTVALGSFDENQASTQEVMMLCSGVEGGSGLGLYLTKFMAKSGNTEVYEDTIA